MSHIVTVGSDHEIKRGKPAPDPYIAAMNRFKDIPISPKNVLVFEDSVSGVLAASAAGATTIMVPQLELLPKSWPEIEASLAQQVDEVIYSVEHFIPEKYGLPALKDLNVCD
jgi:beta-phosphoglucomutase-like phosphatase (HAD superfamily)